MASRHEITLKRIVYSIPGMEATSIRKDVPYRTAETGVLTMDVYEPTEPAREKRPPAVIFINGYSDRGSNGVLGCNMKEMESFVSWGQLVAASGITGITYTTGKDPASDIRALIEHVRQNADSLGIDANRIGLWACSGHGPVALSLLLEPDMSYLRNGVLYYPYTLDLPGFTAVRDASKTFGFANPDSARSEEDLAHGVPLLIVRAGQDQMPGLNETLDGLIGWALRRNLPLRVFNNPVAPHAFDILDDSDGSRDVIQQTLAFMQFHLA